MADEVSRECQNDIPPNHRLLHTWLLDYARHEAFNELKYKKCITETDFIQGVLQKSPENVNAKLLVHLLMLMCKLNNGEDYSTRYIPNSNLTVLEEVLASFDIIIHSFDATSVINKTSSKYRVEIMKQAVFVCCRAGDFDMAAEVFERQWSEVEEQEKSHRAGVQNVIKKRKENHPSLEKQKYEGFIDDMIEFLQMIHDTFPEPFLLKLAEAHINISGDITHNTPNKKRYRLTDLRKELSPIARDSLQQKLKKQREKTVREIIAASVDDCNNSNRNICQDDGVSLAEVDTETTDHSDGGTQKRQSKKDSAKKTHQQREEKSPASLANSLKKRRLHLESLTNQLGNTIETINKPSTSKNGCFVSPQKPYSKSSEESDEENPGDIRHHRYNKNKNRANRHQPPPDNSMASDVSDIEDLDYEDSPKRFKLGKRMRVRRSLQLSENKATLLRPCGRGKVFWTTREEEEFYKAVQEMGVGQWSSIKEALKTFRTSVNLKDKWRNFVTSGKKKLLEKKFGPVGQAAA